MDHELQAILDCPLEENDSGATTIKGYLKALLYALWDEQEGFSGKRPFGNSGWDSCMMDALIDKGIAKSYPAANKLIFKAIQSL